MNDEQEQGRRQKDDAPPRFGAIDALALFTRGLAMGVADVIPGVSGGTIALISGIYERFIGALRSLSLRFLGPLARGRVVEARREVMRIHWAVLIPLGLGIALAMLSMSKLVTGLMEDKPGPTYALFFGLILASSWMPLARAKTRSWRLWAALAIAAVSAWVFVGMGTGTLELEETRSDAGAVATIYAAKLRSPADAIAMVGAANTPIVAFYDPRGVGESVEIATTAERIVIRDDAELAAFVDGQSGLVVLEEKRASLPFIFFSGMIAISAMILPGVSGSFLLLFLGQYQAVFTTAHRIVSRFASIIGREMDPITALSGRSALDDVLFLGVFFVGVGFGLMVFSRVVGWLLDHAHDITMAVLTGIMVGALRQPGSVVLESRPSGESGAYWATCVGAALVGAMLVLGLHLADRLMQNRGVLPDDSQES